MKNDEGVEKNYIKELFTSGFVCGENRCNLDVTLEYKEVQEEI